MPPRLEDVEVVFDALAHETRRHIVLMLAHYGPELPSGYLAQRFTHSWPTTTRHLRMLEAAGIVSVRRDGRNCVYRLEWRRIDAVVGGWLALLHQSSGAKETDDQAVSRHPGGRRPRSGDGAVRRTARNHRRA